MTSASGPGAPESCVATTQTAPAHNSMGGLCGLSPTRSGHIPIVLSTDGAARFVPDTTSLTALARAACDCKGCPLWAAAAQTVFGEGPRTAAIVLVGEQPGDQEGRKGAPFVGPAGRVLWQCLAEAGIDRDGVYVTNAVKHFKHTDRGKRRLHKKPNTAEIEACHPWIEAELRTVRARAVVALGATAARSLTGRNVAIASNRAVQH